jgi:hypothetical protein
LTEFDKNRFYHVMAGRDVRAGGGMCFYHLEQPLPALTGEVPASPEFPPAVELARQAKQQQRTWIEADTAAAWDLPVWIAHGTVDSIRLADHRFGRDTYLESEAGQRPRDAAIYAGADGLGRWSEYVYYQLLNCGLRVPPTAGSGSGDVPNPVGYNRAYVYCGSDFSYQAWWDSLRAGRVVVTNGPMLRPTVEGRHPGNVFRGEPGKTLRLQMELQLATKDKVEYLELVQDGEIAHMIRLDDYVNEEGRLPHLEFERSGWFLVRAVTGAPGTYRFATSGPFYVQFEDDRRISRRSARFFLKWVYERARQISKIPDEQQRRTILDHHRQARDFWQDLVDRANSD